MKNRKLLSYLLLIYVICGVIFSIPNKKVEAFLGVADFAIVNDPIHTGVSLKTIFFEALNAIAIQAANRAVQQIVNSSIEWAQNGFEGNPAYAVDKKQYFLDLADGAVGDFIGNEKSPLNFLCSPFQAQIRLSLQREYIQPINYQCTLTQAVRNIDSFYNNFQDGGWDAWISMTQDSANNPYGAYLEAKLDLDSRVASAVGMQRDGLDRNQGFLDFKYCEKTNPPMRLPAVQGPIEDPGNPNGPPLLNSGGRINPEHVPGKAVGECIEYGATKTPGSIIKSQLDKVLPAGLEKVSNVLRVEQLINAFSTGLLRRYVCGNDGLFSRGNGLATDVGDDPRNRNSRGGVPTPVGIDIEGDGRVDIIDSNGDGDIDSCVYGGEYPNCTRSGDAPTPTQTPPNNATSSSPRIGTGQGIVSGFVFKGLNGDGTMNNGENRIADPISGVRIRIKGASFGAEYERELGSATTGDLSDFTFRGLVSENSYIVIMEVPSGYTATTRTEVVTFGNAGGVSLTFGLKPGTQ